jgi:hypothetical protein
MLPNPQPTVEDVIKLFQGGIERMQKSLEDYRNSFKPSSNCETTPLFWDCECTSLYLHTKDEKRCLICGVYQEEQPDSMITEVLLAAAIWYQSIRTAKISDADLSKSQRIWTTNGYGTHLGGKDE